MSKLGEVLGAILCDIAEAQNISNHYSAEISEEYKAARPLGDFPVPNAYLPEFNLKLKFGIENIVETPLTLQQSYVVAQETFRTYSKDIASKAVELVSNILSSKNETLWGSGDYEADENISEEKLGTIKKNLTSPKFIGFLAERLSKALYEKRAFLLDTKNNLNSDKALKIVLEVLEDILFNHEDLQFVFTQGTKERSRIQKACENEIPRILERMKPSLIEYVPLRKNHDIEVVVNKENLEMLSERSINVIEIKVEMRNFQWVVTEKNGEVIDAHLLAVND